MAKLLQYMCGDRTTGVHPSEYLVHKGLRKMQSFIFIVQGYVYAVQIPVACPGVTRNIAMQYVNGLLAIYLPTGMHLEGGIISGPSSQSA